MAWWKPWRLPRRPSLRRPPLPVAAKPKNGLRQSYKAEGGPYACEHLFLTDGNTALFHARGFYGRYECGIVACRYAPGTTKWRDRNPNP